MTQHDKASPETLVVHAGIDRYQFAPVVPPIYETSMFCFTDAEQGAALFGGEEPRIVGINEYRIDFVPSGNLLVIEHDDRPGMIGKIATRLGDHGVNIGSMYVGRAKGCQLIVSGVDQKIDTDVLNDIEKIEGISEITHVKV